MAHALSIKNLTKTYKSGTVALKGVSLEVPEGDFYALLGPNGAGKTTIIGVVTGLVSKTSGEVSVFGADIEKEPELARTYIGVVPQEMNFNIFEKVMDVVVTQGGYYGIPRKIALERAEKILDGLGLADKKWAVSNTLSGGMKRRLLIARALIHEPKFLVLDEPTAGVDVELRRGMWEYLKTLTAKGTTILLTTHYLEEAEQLAKRVAIINKGEIIADGTMKSVLQNLHTETLVLELMKPASDEAFKSLSAFNPKRTDADTLEVEIDQEQNVSEIVRSLDRFGIPVKTIHGKSGRLEEVFVRLTTGGK